MTWAECRQRIGVKRLTRIREQIARKDEEKLRRAVEEWLNGPRPLVVYRGAALMPMIEYKNAKDN